MLTFASYAMAGLLAGVFGWSAAAKWRAPAATLTSFRGLDLPAAGALVRVVPALELTLAVALVLVPAPAAWAALALLIAFTAVIVRALLRGADVPCACFGGGGDGRAVSGRDLVRNALLAAAAVIATGAGPGLLR